MRERRDHTLRREQGVHYDAISRLRKWVLTYEIAQIKLIDLQENQLRNWCLTLPAHLKPTTIARIATDLKAALNLAVQNHRQQLPVEITSTIRFGLKTNHLQSTEGRKPQILSDDEIRQIIAAARRIDALKGYDGDLARMVLLLAATGARFSQVKRLRTSDIQISKQRIMLPVSRKGRGTKARNEIAFLIGTDVLAEFTKIIEQSSGDELLLQRWTHRKTKLGWERASRGPWTEAASLTRPFREIIKEVGLRPEIVPYALRHSSIVRHLRENLPVRHVAALHDTSVAMIEQHYSAYIVDALDELAARAIIPLNLA